jgi:hypothetical protein
VRKGEPVEQIVDNMSAARRKQILEKIDKQLKLVRIDSVDDSQAADAIPKGRTTEMIREAPKTIDQGGLFLEREAGGKVMKTPFATTAIRLIKHFLKSSEWGHHLWLGAAWLVPGDVEVAGRSHGNRGGTH